MSVEVCGCDAEADWQCERHKYRADVLAQLRSTSAKETIVLTKGQAAICPRCEEYRMVELTTDKMGTQGECAVCSYVWWVTYSTALP